MYFNEDAYWENRREQYEGGDLTVVASCMDCGRDLYECEDCYYINGEYYCDDCIRDSAVTLDEVDYGRGD